MHRARNRSQFHEALSEVCVADKHGEATTPWRKLEGRINRGVGNPSPLLLIGRPAVAVTFLGDWDVAEE